MEEEVFPKIDRLEANLQGVFGSEELEQYEVESGEELLTEDIDVLRSYEVEYERFNFDMSVELGVFEGKKCIGISVEQGKPLQDQASADFVNEVADTYNVWAQPLGTGDYILNIEY